jgi:nucleotide-binding universal stress UspA family protein
LQLLEEPWDTPRSSLDNLLIPLDTSPLADRALDFVRAWPSARGSRLVLLAATDMRPPNRKLNARLRAHLRRCLEERATPLRRAGWRVETRVEDDLAYEAVVRVARAEEFQAVVMATHGRTGVDRYLTGSLAESVARRCGCPTVVVPPGARLSVSACAGAPR